MSIAVTPFEAEYESLDDNGKRHRHACQVVGINDADEFVVITQAADGRYGTFSIHSVWPIEHRELRRIAR